MTKKEKEEPGIFCFKFMNDYTITTDKYQYILTGSKKTGKKDKNGKEEVWNINGFYRCLSSLLADILESEMRIGLIDTGSLEKAIEKINKISADFKKEVSLLQKLEDIDIFKKF